MRKKRCLVYKPHLKKDKSFIAELCEENNVNINFDDIDFVGWSYNGCKSTHIGLAYTKAVDGNLALIGFEFSMDFMDKLWKNLKRPEIYTFVEDFVYRCVEAYKDKGITELEIDIPYYSKTIKKLLSKNNFKKDRLLMIYNGGE